MVGRDILGVSPNTQHFQLRTGGILLHQSEVLHLHVYVTSGLSIRLISSCFVLGLMSCSVHVQFIIHPITQSDSFGGLNFVYCFRYSTLQIPTISIAPNSNFCPFNGVQSLCSAWAPSTSLCWGPGSATSQKARVILGSSLVSSLFQEA